MRFSRTIAAIGLLFTGTPAFSHAALVSASPAAGATASGVKTVTLIFSEALMPPLSGMEIVMTGMPGKGQGDHPAMKMTGVKVAVGPDGKSLIAALAKPLPAGTYDVNWHVVSDDTHRITGKVSFSVR